MQLLIIATCSWLVFNGIYSFSELSVEAFLTQVAPWLIWVKSLLILLFGEFGRWILTFPMLLASPMKFLTSTAIGWWAYSIANELTFDSSYT